MPDNIDASLRALCHSQEHKIKAQHQTIGQLQIGCASLGTLAANYKAELDKMIHIADQYMELMPDCVFGRSIETAKTVSASNGRGPADAILGLVQQNNQLRHEVANYRDVIAGYQTHQDQLEAKLAQHET